MNLSECKFFEIEGNSMRPFFREGQVIAFPFSLNELKRGEIIMFRHNGKNICHRIINRNGDRIVAQGDGNLYNQEHITVTDVIGIVRYIKMKRDYAPTQTRAARLYWQTWLRLPPIVKRVVLRLYKAKR